MRDTLQHNVHINCTLIGSGVDFDSNPINVTFAAGEVRKIVKVPVMCDKIVEGGAREGFNIILTLAKDNHQVRIGRGKSQGSIRDNTGTKYI